MEIIFKLGMYQTLGLGILYPIYALLKSIAAAIKENRSKGVPILVSLMWLTPAIFIYIIVAIVYILSGDVKFLFSFLEVTGLLFSIFTVYEILTYKPSKQNSSLEKNLKNEPS